MQSPTTAGPSRQPLAYRLLLWVLLIVVTAADTYLVLRVADAYGRDAAYWLVQQAMGDPLLGLLLAETLVLRWGLFLVGARFAGSRGHQRLAAWLLLVPVLGGPLVMAALLADGDEAA